MSLTHFSDTYGCVARNATGKVWRRLQANEIRFIKAVKGKIRWDRIRKNSEEDYFYNEKQLVRLVSTLWLITGETA